MAHVVSIYGYHQVAFSFVIRSKKTSGPVSKDTFGRGGIGEGGTKAGHYHIFFAYSMPHI